MVFNSRVVPVFMLRLPKISGSSINTIAAIALLDKIKNIKCHVLKKRKRNMYNFACTIKSKHEYKILPRCKPKVLQRKTEFSRYVLWNFAVTEKTICCRE